MLRANDISGGACYFNQYWRMRTAYTILNSSTAIFYEASTIQHLDEFDEVFSLPNPEKNLHRINMVLNKLRDPNLITQVIDAMKIITCFENSLKSELLFRGYVIHKIDPNINNRQYANFAHSQVNAPVIITEIKRAEGLLRKKKNNYVFNSLLDRTIPFSYFLKKPSYQSAINLPPRIITALNRIYSKRNTLHWLEYPTASYGKPIIDEFKELRTYINTRVAKRRDLLAKKMSRH